MQISTEELAEHFIKDSIKIMGVFHRSINPGTSGFQISSPFPGFIFPISGEARFDFNGTPYNAREGNIIHGGANMKLDKKVISKKKWEYISVLYDINSDKPEKSYLPNSHFEIRVGESPRLREILFKLSNSFNKKSAISQFQTDMLFRCALEEVFICGEYNYKDDAKALFEKASSYIKDNFMDTLSVRGLANQFGVNENRLFYVFNKYSGMGPGDYIIDFKFEKAKKMLIDSNANISKISDSIGYTDPLYFSRIFKRKSGLSPSEFRKKFRNNP